MSTTFETSSATFQPETTNSENNYFEYSSFSEETADLVENIRNFLSQFDGSEYKDEKVYAAFEKVFDKDVSVLTFPASTSVEEHQHPENRVTLDFHSFYHQVIAVYGKMRIRLEDISIHVPSESAVEYYFSGNHQGHRVTVHICAETRNGKIIRTQHKDRTYAAVENFKRLVSLYDGSGSYDRNVCYRAFSAAFNKDAIALSYVAGTCIDDLGDSSKRITFNFEEMFENLSKWAEMIEGPVRVVYAKAMEGGILEYSLQGSYKGCLLTTQSKASTHHGKIVYVETKTIQQDA